MAATEVTAETAQTSVASIQVRIAYHKRQIKKHRRLAQDAARELEDLHRKTAEKLGFDVVIVPQAHSQEAQSKCPPTPH